MRGDLRVGTPRETQKYRWMLEPPSAPGRLCNEDRLSCCRFDGHRDWVLHTAGGRLCRDEDSVESSRLRQSSWSENAGCLRRKPAETWAFMRTCCANGEGVRL